MTPGAGDGRAYAALREHAGLVGEEAPAPRRIGELELQAKLYGGGLGTSWTGEDGEAVEIRHFGTWNREAGPDFTRAKIMIQGKAVSGDVELDLDCRDWERHGHARNPAYDRVVLHIFTRRSSQRFFTRTSGNCFVPQVCLAGSHSGGNRKQPPLAAAPGLPPKELRQLIEAAAWFRLWRKREGFLSAAALHGGEEALFQGLSAGLGYKNNKIPFALVAQRCGLSRSARTRGEALLFGLAGFLRAGDFDAGDPEARDYLRSLWDAWWPCRDREARLVLPEPAWNFSGVRPNNHPHRRMAALALAARSLPQLARAVDAADAASFTRILTGLEHPYWSRHANLACSRLSRKVALVGGDRARDLLLDVFLPALSLEKAWPLLKSLHAPAPSRKIRQAARWLCQEPFLPESAIEQQGLLQLADDFFPEDPGRLWELWALRRRNFREKIEE